MQIGFTFLVPAHLGSPGKRAVKWVCVCLALCTVALFTTLINRSGHHDDVDEYTAPTVQRSYFSHTALLCMHTMIDLSLNIRLEFR